MRIRWSPEAVEDLQGIVLHIRKSSPETARRISGELDQGVGRLKDYPHSGRPGRVAGTRELVYPGLPWLEVYRVQGQFVEIARVLHGRQRWP